VYDLVSSRKKFGSPTRNWDCVKENQLVSGGERSENGTKRSEKFTIKGANYCPRGRVNREKHKKPVTHRRIR